MSNTARSTVEETIVRGILNLLPEVSGCVKTPAWNAETIPEGTGVIAAEITKKEQVVFGYPNWWIYLSVMGQTFVSCDPDRKKICAIHDAVLAAVSAWTPAFLSGAMPAGAAVKGILPMGNVMIRENDEKRAFNVDLKLAVTDLTFN